jgi:hydroxypyruvate isomerase
MNSGNPLYAPNISWLLPEMPFAKRARTIAEAGFTGCELGFSSHADLDGLKAVQGEYGLKVILFNLDVPVWDEANRGYLAEPARRDEFKLKLDEALEIVEHLKVEKVMLSAGRELPDLSNEEQRSCVIENLLYAAPLAEETKTLFTLEFLNPSDNSGYYLKSASEGLDIVAEVDHPHIKFQFDTYHVQLMEGNVTQKMVDNIANIGHVQFADVPGRHEPGTGELNFDFIEASLRKAGYSGYIGLEYIPKAKGMEALTWCMA